LIKKAKKQINRVTTFEKNEKIAKGISKKDETKKKKSDKVKKENSTKEVKK
jgi:hypothetical protein